MPRSSRAQEALNRTAVVNAASVLLRERGVAGVTIDAVSARAGLTRGGFYKKFASKEALVREALDTAVSQRRDALGALTSRAGDDARAVYIADYLSPDHRDDAASGCAIAALASDASDTADFPHDLYDGALRGLLGRLTELDPQNSDENAMADLATMVGALMLARAASDPALSDAVLSAARRRLLDE